MEGFKAIAYYNGWAMAVVGASIVFMGLVVLSAAISQIHKLLMLWEDRSAYVRRAKEFQSRIFNHQKKQTSKTECFLDDIRKTAQSYNPLINQLGKTFQLSDLYHLAEKNNFAHPHLTITKFRNEKILIPEGDGTFTWNLPLQKSKG